MEKNVLFAFPCPHCKKEVETTGDVKFDKDSFTLTGLIENFVCPHCGNTICFDEEELEE